MIIGSLEFRGAFEIKQPGKSHLQMLVIMSIAYLAVDGRQTENNDRDVVLPALQAAKRALSSCYLHRTFSGACAGWWRGTEGIGV